MMKFIRLLRLCGLVGVMGLVSCHRDLYDAGEHEKLIEDKSTVGDVDENHTWTLDSRRVVGVRIPEDEQCERVLVLQRAESGWYEVLVEHYLGESRNVNIPFSAPTLQTSFFLAVARKDGTYVLKEFTPGASLVSYTEEELAGTGTRLNLTYQTWTYCFEEDYPLPGDYDYNDVVLRVMKRRTGPCELQLSVTLSAVGGTIQMAGAIRLAGIALEDVKKVTAAGSSMHFKGDYPMASTLIEKKDTLFAARNGDAVISLFEDAHWATGDNLTSSYGVTSGRHYINTSVTKGGAYMTATPRTVVYQVTFADERVLDNLAMNQLDVFIVKPYNTGIGEIHAYEYRQEQVLRKFTFTTTKGLPWAMRIPVGNFRWPVEGLHLGYYKDNVLFGAYQELDHSFGQWAADHNAAKDWYLHPTNNLIY